MKQLIFTLLLFIVCGCKSKKQQTTEITNNLEPIEAFTIAFGSCNKEEKKQPLWQDISAENPDLWIWLGDNIYGDTEDMGVMQKKYTKQNANIAYQKFKTNIPIIGTWDDHDYGVNDGDKNYPKRSESRDLALDFLDVPQNAEVRKREGMYQSFEYSYKDIDIRIILLDTRYFRDPIKKSSLGYTATPGVDILGSQQWTWLEAELQKEEDILIIGNGTQVIPNEHRFEKWGNFPESRDRLLYLLDKETANKIVLISGDRHIGEMSSITTENKIIYEVTSSGLTHSYSGVGKEANQHRIGNLTKKLNYGLIHIQPNGNLELLLCGEGRNRHLTHSVNSN